MFFFVFIVSFMDFFWTIAAYYGNKYHSAKSNMNRQIRLFWWIKTWIELHSKILITMLNTLRAFCVFILIDAFSGRWLSTLGDILSVCRVQFQEHAITPQESQITSNRDKVLWFRFTQSMMVWCYWSVNAYLLCQSRNGYNYSPYVLLKATELFFKFIVMVVIGSAFRSLLPVAILLSAGLLMLSLSP